MACNIFRSYILKHKKEMQITIDFYSDLALNLIKEQDAKFQLSNIDIYVKLL